MVKTADIEKLWRNVKVGGPTDCWPCRFSKFPSGHVGFWMEGRTHQAHRAAWLFTNGPIPEGMCVLHRCDNPPCCNPAHLFLGTRIDNVRDRDSKGRQAIGARHAHSKLTMEIALEIRAMRATGVTLSSLAAKYGVHRSTIRCLLRGDSWKTRGEPAW
jgi:hypothetical protein